MPWENYPGNDLRVSLQTDIISALSTSEWFQIDEKYASLKTPNSALLIGDARGELWSKQHGSIKLDETVPMASQSKIIAALAIYGLMRKSNGTLTLSTRPSQFIAAWPRSGNAGNVTLSHLLSFTTGFKRMDFLRDPGCARDSSMVLLWVYHSENSNNWESCLNEIAGYTIEYPPGTSFQYGPWHLFTAAGMAMRATGKPLTKDAWIQVVTEEVFEPAGITVTPKYGTATWNNPNMPDFSGGLEMSARQWQKIMHQLQFGNLLSQEEFKHFTADHTAQVERQVQSFPYSTFYLLGGWHYAHGHWRVCDALAADSMKEEYKDKKKVYSWTEANEICGFKLRHSSSGPLPNVHHSFGIFGSYVWMDLTNDYYGIYIQYHNPFQVFERGTIIILVVYTLAVLVSIICGLMICRRTARASVQMSSVVP